MIRYNWFDYWFDLNPVIYVLSKTKDVNVKISNMITTIKEVKTLIKHISCDFKCKFISATCNSNQNVIM